MGEGGKNVKLWLLMLCNNMWAFSEYKERGAMEC